MGLSCRAAAVGRALRLAHGAMVAPRGRFVALAPAPLVPVPLVPAQAMRQAPPWTILSSGSFGRYPPGDELPVGGVRVDGRYVT